MPPIKKSPLVKAREERGWGTASKFAEDANINASRLSEMETGRCALLYTHGVIRYPKEGLDKVAAKLSTVTEFEGRTFEPFTADDVAKMCGLPKWKDV